MADVLVLLYQIYHHVGTAGGAWTRRRGSVMPRLLRAIVIVAVLVSGLSGLAARAGEALPIVTVEFPPFGYTDPSGKIRGASTEIVEEVVRRMGFEPKVESVPTKRAFLLASEGTYAAFFTITKSKPRLEKLIYTDPVADIADVFFKRKTDPITWASLADLSDKIVGATDGYNYAPVFLTAMRDGTLKTDMIASNSPELQHLRKLALGRIDLMICERSVCNHLLRTHDPKFSGLDHIDRNIGPVRTFHVGFSKKWPGAADLVKRFNAALAAMWAEGKIQEIHQRYGIISSKDLLGGK